MTFKIKLRIESPAKTVETASGASSGGRGRRRDIDKMSTKQSSRWSIDTRIFVNCGIDGVGIDRVKIDD
jgi:hypothetical protein